jgi:hypothetical protein
MKLLTVIKNGKFTGTQYEQDSDAIRAHHASQGETLVFLDYRLTAAEDGDYGSPSGAEVKKQLMSDLSAERKLQERQGVTINGIRYAGDSGNRQALKEAIEFMEDAGLTEFPKWKCSDDEFHVNHPLADVVQAYRAIGIQRVNLIATEGNHANKIISGKITDLKKVKW